MNMGDAEMRSRAWAALANQPGVSAWFAVWLLSRYSGVTAPRRQTDPKATARMRGNSSQTSVRR